MLNKEFVELLVGEKKMYPQAQLIDYFKVIFQACYGPGHGISNYSAAREYYLNEFALLDSDQSEQNCMIQDLSYPNGFYRVNLAAVKQELISRDELFEGFVHSSKIKCDSCQFDQLWAKAVRFVVEELGINEDKDSLESITRFFTSGSFPSHSNFYRKHYSPHYRLLYREFIPERLLRLL